MEIAFDKIHKIVLETLQPQVKKATILDTLGAWYYAFLCSDEKALNLKLPYYEPKSIDDIYQYLRIFLLTYKLINKPKLSDFKDTCLFNIFSFSKSYSRFDANEYLIDFVSEKEDLLLWNGGVLISKRTFLPVFSKGQFGKIKKDALLNTFKLFKAIRNNGVIDYPILIDLEMDLSLSLCNSKELDPEEYLLFETIAYNKNRSDDDDIELEESLSKKDISDQLSITYPYNRNIRSWFLGIAKKRFELNIYDRFCYDDISNGDLFLLPPETFLNRDIAIDFISKVNILNTDHGQVLFQLMISLKEKWKNYEFNKYTTPFPKYWFLFINKSVSKEEWLSQFKQNYPRVAETPIIRDIEKIIEQLHELNWIEAFLRRVKDPTILVPEMNGAKGKRLKTAFVSFKNYLLAFNPKIQFVDVNENYKYGTYKNLIILEAFNVIDIVNIIQCNKPTNYLILVPDFIYFSYQPWIKFQLVSYQSNALLSPMRKSLDKRFQSNLSVWQDIKYSTIKEIRKEIKLYQQKYDLTIDNVPLDIELGSEDFQFRNSEEVELIRGKKEKSHRTEIEILSAKGYQVKLSSNSKVIIQRNSIVAASAIDIRKGDYFISINELNSSIDYDRLIDRLSAVPKTAQRFQIKLNEYDSVYKILEQRGLHYSSESYFNSKYIISPDRFQDHLFIVPRKRKHWELICEFLSIDSNDMSLTWIAHYGRKHINEVKGIYRHILDLFLSEKYLGEAENPALIEQVTNYVRNKEDVFDYGEEFNPGEIAKSMISSIINILDFHEVIEIKTLSA